VRTRVGLSVDGQLSLHPWTSTYPAGGTTTHHDACNLDVGSGGVKFCLTAACDRDYRMRRASALRPTAVSEGRSANKEVCGGGRLSKLNDMRDEQQRSQSVH